MVTNESMQQFLRLIAGLCLIGAVVALDYNEIVLAANHNIVLVMTENTLSFRSRAGLEKADQRTFMTLENGSVKIGDRFICKTRGANGARPCRTSTAIGGKFTLLFEEGHSVLMQDNHNVLGPGPYDLNTDSYPAIIVDADEFPNKAYYLDIRTYIEGQIREVNPAQREFKN